MVINLGSIGLDRLRKGARFKLSASSRSVRAGTRWFKSDPLTAPVAEARMSSNVDDVIRIYDLVVGQSQKLMTLAITAIAFGKALSGLLKKPEFRIAVET